MIIKTLNRTFSILLFSFWLCDAELNLRWPYTDMDHAHQLIYLFKHLIQVKDTFSLKYLNIKFSDTGNIRLRQLAKHESNDITSLLTKITCLTSLKAIAISPIHLILDDRKYLQQFWFVDPFGECSISKHKGKSKMKFQDVYVARYDVAQ